jgi:hypothetical protein
MFDFDLVKAGKPLRVKKQRRPVGKTTASRSDRAAAPSPSSPALAWR